MTKQIIEITKYFHNDLKSQRSLKALEWTGIWNVCPPVGTGSVPFSQYLETEDAYVRDIVSILENLKIFELTITGLKRFKRALGVSGAVPSALSTGKKVRLENLGGLIRANLRWQIECRLYADSRVFIVFGDDMYCYIGLQSVHPISISPSSSLISHRDVSDRVVDKDRFYWGGRD